MRDSERLQECKQVSNFKKRQLETLYINNLFNNDNFFIQLT